MGDIDKSAGLPFEMSAIRETRVEHVSPFFFLCVSLSLSRLCSFSRARPSTFMARAFLVSELFLLCIAYTCGRLLITFIHHRPVNARSGRLDLLSFVNSFFFSRCLRVFLFLPKFNLCGFNYWYRSFRLYKSTFWKAFK